MPIAFQIFSSPIGELLIAGTEFAVTHVTHGHNRQLLSADFLLEHDNARSLSGNTNYLVDAANEILRYLHGETSRIDVAIQVDGTDFQRKVWQALRQIPYGTTKSYRETATNLGMPDAFRAVANACGSNPVPLIVPCHRVIHKSGETSGFAWGKDVKNFLLDMEKEHASMLQAA